MGAELLPQRLRRLSRHSGPFSVLSSAAGGLGFDLVRKLLPAHSSAVLVRFHDIFLSWEHPREFQAERNFFWAGQYLLQAFFAFIEKFEILFSGHALQRGSPDAVSRLAPSAGLSVRPAAFWLRRVDSQ